MTKLETLLKKRAALDEQISKLKKVKTRPQEAQRIRCKVKCHAWMKNKTATITGIYNPVGTDFPKESHVLIDSGEFAGEFWLWRRVIEWSPVVS
jgi:hypothetical protein